MTKPSADIKVPSTMILMNQPCKQHAKKEAALHPSELSNPAAANSYFDANE